MCIRVVPTLGPEFPTSLSGAESLIIIFVDHCDHCNFALTQAAPQRQHEALLSEEAVVVDYVRAFDEAFAEVVPNSLWEVTLQTRKRIPPRCVMTAERTDLAIEASQMALPQPVKE